MKKGKRQPLPFGEAVLPAHEDNFEEGWQPDDLEKMYTCLSKLAPNFKEVLILRFFEKMSYDEISQVIQCNLGTVKSRLHNAKVRLKKEMEKR